MTTSINHERMPVLLTSDAEWETWLRGTAEEAFALCRPFDAEQMKHVGEGLEKKDRAAE